MLFIAIGYRCGYVEIPPSHRLVGRGFGNIDIDCHGGLTFGDYVNHVYTIGFDCAHYRDGYDFKQSYDYGLITEREMQELTNSYCCFKGYYQPEFYLLVSLEQVEEELRNIVDQIIEKYSR